MDDWKIRILILDRGYVKVCYCPDPNGCCFWLPYRQARTIRRWGTTNGIGELVHGPKKNTILDNLVETGTVPVRAIIDILDVEQSKWTKHLLLHPASSKDVTNPRVHKS